MLNPPRLVALIKSTLKTFILVALKAIQFSRRIAQLGQQQEQYQHPANDTAMKNQQQQQLGDDTAMPKQQQQKLGDDTAMQKQQQQLGDDTAMPKRQQQQQLGNDTATRQQQKLQQLGDDTATRQRIVEFAQAHLHHGLAQLFGKETPCLPPTRVSEPSCIDIKKRFYVPYNLKSLPELLS